MKYTQEDYDRAQANVERILDERRDEFVKNSHDIQWFINFNKQFSQLERLYMRYLSEMGGLPGDTGDAYTLLQSPDNRPGKA